MKLPLTIILTMCCFASGQSQTDARTVTIDTDRQELSDDNVVHKHLPPIQSVIIDGQKYNIVLADDNKNQLDVERFTRLKRLKVEVLPDKDIASTNFYVVKNTDNVSVNFNYKGLYYFSNPEKNNIMLGIDHNEWQPETQINDARYIEVTIKAIDDSITIDNISFNIQAFGADDLKFTVLGSLNRNLENVENYVDMEEMKTEPANYTFDTDIWLAAGQIYRLRFYPWSKKGGTKKYIVLDNITITGNK
ncbi:MAG: hypothetical protein LBV31_00320 [Prevotellaceae bacterium]|jgi:hypothetical protein|nr:hypothetical protein [Prevotellaceae bacterium]